MPQEKADKRLHLQVIRDNEDVICPFALPIPEGCKSAGKLVMHLQPALSPEIAEKNNQVFLEFKQEERCIFAQKIMENKDKVICEYPEEEKIEMPTGSPLYYKPMSGTLMTGLMTFPLGYYNDNSLDRSHYYGYYSIESLSSENNKNIIKNDYKKAIDKLLKLRKYSF